MAVKALLEKVRCAGGQMTVELCVVVPAAIIVAVIASNALSFFGSCAEFDRVARNAVRSVAASPGYEQASAQSAAKVRALLQGSMDAANLSCEVGVNSDYRGYQTYEMTLEYAPTLFGLGMRSEVFGVQTPKLRHTATLTVDPYKPGMLF